MPHKLRWHEGYLQDFIGEVVGSLDDPSLWLDLLAAVAPLEVEDRRELLSARTLCERAHLLLGGLVHVIDGRLEGLEQRVMEG